MGSSPTPSSTDAPASPGEFRRYRRFVSWLILTFVSLGSTYLLVSVGVTIWRRRNALPAGEPVGALATAGELESCHQEVSDVAHGLGQHLDNFQLLGHYDAAEAQKWAEGRSFWLGQWKAAEERCRFSVPRHGKFSKEWEQLSVIHTELRETEASYNKELLRFGKDQAPRLDRIIERLERVGKKLGTSGAADPAESPQSNASTDAGDKTQ
jgi:hypothetical protein